MGAATARPDTSARVIDESEGLIEQTCSGLEVKSEGEEDFVVGYLATKGVDNKKDMFSEDALQQMADEINRNGGVAKVFFPSPEMIQSAVDKARRDNPNKNVNVDHYNSHRRGDPRIVSAFALTEAEFDGFGTKVKARLMTESIPGDTVETIKNAVENGLLNAFSVEWFTKSFSTRRVEGKVVRVIEEAEFRGAALTGRPVNDRAKITQEELKSLAGEELEEERNQKSPEEEEVKSDEHPHGGEEATEENVENDTTGETMPEDEPEDEQEETPEDEGGEEAQTEETSEVEEFSEELEEVKSMAEEVKSENKELREQLDELEDENEELKSELEDYQELEELKSDISYVKEELKSLEPEDETLAEQDQNRMEETKSEEESKVESMVDTFSDEHGRLPEEKARAIADKFNKPVEEVKNLA